MKKCAFWLCLICLAVLALPGLAVSLTAVGRETETVTREWESNLFFPRMEELTGITVTGHGVSGDKDYRKLLTEMMNGKVEYDMLFKSDLTREQEEALIDSGAIIDLSPYLESMPNLSALLSEHPEWKEKMALADGRIATLPMFNPGERQVCVWINSKWMETLELGTPETIGELTDVLSAFANRDPNGNGARDEKAADIIGVYEMRWLLPYFGIVADDYHLAKDEEGHLVFAPELPEYRTFVETMRDWVEKGILSLDAFTDTHVAEQYTQINNNSTDKEVTITSGMLVSLTPFSKVQVAQVTQYQALLLQDPSGKVRWRNLAGDVWPGCFAVTSACQDIPAALAWVDALYTEEGMKLAILGKEGTDYEWREDGTWAYIITDERSVENLRAEVILSTGTSLPGLYPAETVAKVESEPDRWVFAESERVHQFAERVTEPLLLSSQNREKANQLAGALTEAVDKGIARFVTGEVPIDDEHWNAWVADLQELGSQELIRIFEQ